MLDPRKVVWLVCSIAICSCSFTSDKNVRLPRKVDEVVDFANIEVIDPLVRLNRSQDVRLSTFGYNPRQWEPSNIEDFQYPAIWLSNPDMLKQQIYVVKQVGRSALFCLIKPSNEANKTRRDSAHYTLFLIRTEKADSRLVWDDYLQEKFGEDYCDYRNVETVAGRLVQVNPEANQFWSSPMVFYQQRDEVSQIILLYQGESRSYVNQLLNKFPWRSLAQG